MNLDRRVNNTVATMKVVRVVVAAICIASVGYGIYLFTQDGPRDNTVVNGMLCIIAAGIVYCIVLIRPRSTIRRQRRTLHRALVPAGKIVRLK